MLHIGPVEPSQLYGAFLEAFADYAMNAAGTTEERLRLRIRKNAVDLAVSPGLYDDDRLVGFTLIGIDGWGGRLTAYDAGTGIVPEFRKRGWAKRMFDHALPELGRRGVERFALEVLRGNKPAIKAYRKSGFSITRELHCFVIDVDDVREISTGTELAIRPIDRSTLAVLESSADWLPSFENRFSAVDALPDSLLLGAVNGETCVGAVAYSPSLNWLLTLVVDRDHRRCGVGTALIRSLAKSIPESSKRLTALNVDGGDEGMQSFFRALGFTHLVDQFEMIRDVRVTASPPRLTATPSSSPPPRPFA